MRAGQIIFLLLLVLAGTACQSNRATIRGVVKNGEATTITLERLDINRTTFIDSVLIKKDGKFSFSTNPEYPELYVLNFGGNDLINLLVAPGDEVTVTTSADSFGSGYEVAGSEESENIRKLVRQLNSTRSTLDSLYRVVESIEDPESPHLGVVRSAYSQAIIAQKRSTIRYLIGHMNSLSSIYALYQKYNEENLVMGEESDLQYFKVVADSLDIAHPNSSLTRSLRADIEQREASFKQMSQMNSLLEMVDETTGVLDLSIPDRNGKSISLSELRGKVVLVVFWASVNNESIKALLQLKSTYNKYHPEGFEIYAVSLDNNKVQWMNAVDFNEYNWINVSELTYPDSKAGSLYNVTELPSGYLINREGDIVAKNLYGRTLETWLDNLL
jgi:peroxiredoxin